MISAVFYSIMLSFMFPQKSAYIIFSWFRLILEKLENTVKGKEKFPVIALTGVTTVNTYTHLFLWVYLW